MVRLGGVAFLFGPYEVISGLANKDLTQLDSELILLTVKGTN